MEQDVRSTILFYFAKRADISPEEPFTEKARAVRLAAEFYIARHTEMFFYHGGELCAKIREKTGENAG